MSDCREPIRKSNRAWWNAIRAAIGVVFAGAGWAPPALAARAPGLLRPLLSIPLAGVEGRIDHMAADLPGQRLFVAALGNGSVEVIDLQSGSVARTLRDFREPQGVGFASNPGRLFVTNAGDGSCDVLDGTTFERVRVLRLGSDADNVRYDASAKRIYAGYGEGGLAILDSGTGDDWGRVPLAAHPEAFELDAAGTTAFVNVPDLDEVAVVDLAKRCVTTTWKLEPHRANYPMALDAAGHRLFVGCRNPAAVVVLDERTGQTQTALPIDGDPDDLFFDPSDARLYAICGAGYVDVIDARPGALKIVGSVATGPGARTGLFVPELGRLFVAVPHRGSQRAEVRVFELPGAGKRDPK